MADNKYMSDEQLEFVADSIKMPIIFSEDGDSEKIIGAISIVEMGSPTVLNIPESITLERINANGMVTTGTYMLVESYKTHEKNFMGEDN